MYTGNRCGGGLNFYPNVYTLVREEESASAGTIHTRASKRAGHTRADARAYVHACTYTCEGERVHTDERV